MHEEYSLRTKLFAAKEALQQRQKEHGEQILPMEGLFAENASRNESETNSGEEAAVYAASHASPRRACGTELLFPQQKASVVVDLDAEVRMAG
jgi:hypothetical protein